LQAEFEVVKRAHAEEKAALEQRIQEADRRIAELSQLIEDFKRATGRSAADIGVDIEKVKTQIMELRGQQEVDSHRLEVLERKLSGIKDDLSAARSAEQLRKEEEARQKLEAAREAARPRDPLEGIKRPEKMADFYKLALSLLESGQTEAGRLLFGEFLSRWPTGEFSDNAQYWIGESFYGEKRFKEAALAFQTVREKFPKSDKYPDATYKLGMCFVALEMWKEAVPFFAEFVQNHPKHPLIQKAREKLKEAEKRSK
jgi:tol-pal system protein YbgF